MQLSASTPYKLLNDFLRDKTYLLVCFCRMVMISENWGRFDGQLFQHFIISDLSTCGQSLGISGLNPQAAMPTAAWTGEYEEYAASPVTISQTSMPKL